LRPLSRDLETRHTRMRSGMLTFGTTLIADGPGGFGFDLAIGGAVPKPQTWAMMMGGVVGLGLAGHCSAQQAGRRGRVSCG
jgi:hypothetical protein